MIDWSKLPDVGAIALLTCAFGSVARRRRSQISGAWLVGWVMIALHFAAFMFAPAAGAGGTLAVIVGLSSLTWAGVLFMWSSVPYRNQWSSRWMVSVLIGTNTLYITVITLFPKTGWALALSAILFGILPLAVTLIGLSAVRHPLRWAITLMYCGLSVFLLLFQNLPGNGADLALNAVLFTVYLGCTVYFSVVYQRITTGAFITIAGFLAWAAVFVVAPGIQAYLPAFHLESEVWNLPKYVVAVGMILLVLEEQIEHNQYLALHDELTGLPNRRLFLDRLSSALQRARRTGSQTALLSIDLDRFKEVNDTAGHHVGDLLLSRVGELLITRVRRSDTVARTGGDEFSVILEEPANREDAERVSAALTQLLGQPLQLENRTVHIGASIGIAIFPSDGATGESLCIAADRDMYAAKNAARRKAPENAIKLSLDLSQSLNN